jgi:hypothetical protein
MCVYNTWESYAELTAHVQFAIHGISKDGAECTTSKACPVFRMHDLRAKGPARKFIEQ